jgi:hypothetical protein
LGTIALVESSKDQGIPGHLPNAFNIFMLGRKANVIVHRSETKARNRPRPACSHDSAPGDIACSDIPAPVLRGSYIDFGCDIASDNLCCFGIEGTRKCTLFRLAAGTSMFVIVSIAVIRYLDAKLMGTGIGS